MPTTQHTTEAQAKGRDARIPFIADEAGIQAKLDSLKMPSSIRYEWDGTTLVVTETEYNTVTRWMFQYRHKSLTYEQVGDPLCNGVAMKALEWRRSNLWHPHAVALTILARRHQAEVLERIRQ
jgi:hypothetical protein